MKPILLIPILLFVYLITHLINLTSLPIFADEANYLDWGWRQTHTPHFLFYSLYDAKPPLVMWLFGLAQSLISNPLLAGRLVALLFGLATFFGLYKISGPLAAILYTLIPVFVFFDRQALMETPISAIGVWGYYFLSRYLDSSRLKFIIFLAVTLGLGIFIKTNALLFLIPTLFILTAQAAKQKSLVPVTAAIFLLLTLTLTLTPLLFQPQFWSTLSSNSRFSLTPSELMGFPVLHWLANLWTYLQISFWHLTPLVFIAILLGFKNTPHRLRLWVLVPFVVLILTSRSPSPRYLVSFLPLLLLPAANFLSRHRLFLALSLLPPLVISTILIISPPDYFRLLNKFTPFSQIENYLTGPNTGYQVTADLKFIHSLTPPAIIAVALNSGNPEAALIDYFHSSKNIQVIYFDSQLLRFDISLYECFSSQIPLYFIARTIEQAGLEKFFTKHAVITNPYNSDFNNVYVLKSGCPKEKTAPLFLTKS